jgi:tRNA dimethylallyltransferase
MTTDLICILGPTAIGKTKVAVTLAHEIGGEIISADSRQVYRQMDIGTGKDLDEYIINGKKIPYHLIDITDPGTEFNVFEYQQAFLDAYNKIKITDNIPILCGGTGMYLDSIINGYDLIKVNRDEKLRAELTDKSDKDLTVMLTALRPLHNTTDTTSRERLIRAIEIAVHAEDQVLEKDRFPKLNTQIFGLRLDRAILKERITVRLKERLANGMIEEIKLLLEKGLTAEQLEFYGLEYKLVTQYVTGKLNYNDMYQKLREAIYQFARRQEKWFRRMERKGTIIIWLDTKDKSPTKLVTEIIANQTR